MLNIDPQTRPVSQLLPTNQLRKFHTTKEICNTVTVELTGGEEAVRFSFGIDDTESNQKNLYLISKLSKSKGL